jgi:hypothetical protein
MKCENFFKVGMSAAPEERKRYLETAAPFKIEIVYTTGFETKEDAIFAEKLSHSHLKDLGLHLKLEWFNGELIKLIEICDLCAEISKNKNRLKNKKIIEKLLFFLQISKLEIVYQFTKIEEDRLNKILKEKKMTKNEALLLNSLFLIE